MIEALECGTPVVAIRYVGPEDVVTPEVGVLVPTEDVSALAEAIEDVLETCDGYNPARLRAYVLVHQPLETDG